MRLEDFVNRFLQALCDPEGGKDFYAMHCPDAPVRHEGAIRWARDVDPQSFYHAHRQTTLSSGDKLPTFGRATLRQGPGVPDSFESVAWFDVVEARDQRPLILAIGLQQWGTEFRVGWCTLAARVESWSYEDGRLQSLADYPWMRASKPAVARALLDASYFRHHWRAAVTFTTLADMRFSCHMSTACCKHDFEIALPPEAQLLIDAIPWRTIAPHLAGTRLLSRPDGQLQLKSVNETCRFLGPRRQCLIHQTLGQQPFGACCVFPYAFAQTPDGVAVSLSPICGSSRMGLGGTPLERENDLREKLVHAEPRSTEHYRLTPSQEISWQTFSDVEKALCECLAAEELSMRRRLYVGTQLLGAVRCGEAMDLQGWLTAPFVEISGELRQAICDMLGKILKWDRATLRALPLLIPPELFKREVTDASVVARILRYVMYSKVYSYQFDLTTAFNLVIVLYLIALIMQSAMEGVLSDAMWQELGSLGVHGLLRNLLHDGVPEGFRTLFGTHEFGQWALAV